MQKQTVQDLKIKLPNLRPTTEKVYKIYVEYETVNATDIKNIFEVSSTTATKAIHGVWEYCAANGEPIYAAPNSRKYVSVAAVCKPGGVYDYGKFKISPVRLYHNVLNCGYRVYFGAEKLIYATDTNTMAGITAQNYDNYTTAEIQERIAQKQRAGGYAYETQVLHNRLSFEAAQQWLADNIGPEGRYVFLHGHEERTKNDGYNFKFI